MTPEEIVAILKGKFGEKIAAANFQTAHPHAVVAAGAWREVARFLRDDDRLRLNFLRCISSVDSGEGGDLVAVYDLIACDGQADSAKLWTSRHGFCVKVKAPKASPHVPSVADIWPAADWHEREAYDLMGIIFDGHPDAVDGPEGRHPRRILCPDDWEGHPLRKDYVFPMEYHGIPAVTEYEQTRPVH